MSEGRVLRTAAGDLEIVTATEQWIEYLATQWPLQILSIVPREDAWNTHNERARHVLPFSGDGRHVNIIYLPQVPRDIKEAKRRARLTRSMGAAIVLDLMNAGFGGLALPLTTLRDEGAVGVPGLGLVVGPAPGGEPDDAPNPAAIALNALNAAILTGLPFEASSKPKYVPPSVTGALTLDFGLLDGTTVICFRHAIDPQDPCVESLARAGIKSLVHMPLQGTVLPDRSTFGERLERPKTQPLKALPAEPPPEGSDASAELLEISANGARRIYRILCHIAACDGHVDATEREILDDFVQRFDVSAEDAKRLEDEGRSGKGFSIGKSLIERELLFELMVDVAAADGVLHKSEEKRLVIFANSVGISRERLRGRIQERFGTEAAELTTPTPKAKANAKTGASAGGLRRIYRLLWYVAGSDGDVGPEEDALLDAFGKRCGIGTAEAATLRGQGLRGEGLKVGKSDAERALLLDELVAIASADGEITPVEMRRLRKFTKLLKVPTEELEQRLRKELAKQAPDEALTTHDPSPDTGRVLLLDVPKHIVAVNLIQVAVEGGFRGFKYVPAGVHRFAIPLAGGNEASQWVSLQPGEVEVLVFDGDTLDSAKGDGRWTQQQRLALSGAMDNALLPFTTHIPWRLLTASFAHAPFPPPCFPVPESPPDSRLALIYEEHYGKSMHVVAELAYTFLSGVLGDDREAMQRWTHMVQAFYHCGEQSPKLDPQAFVWVVDLLMEQQRLLPQEMFSRESPLVYGGRYLSEDLIDTEVPKLVEAGRRWAVFIAGRHAGAPPAPTLPQSMQQKNEMPAVFAEGLAEKALEIEAIERNYGRFAAELLPPLSYTTSIREMGGDLQGALDAQERMVEIGERCGTPPDHLSKGYGRLGRLYREAGRAMEAMKAEERSRRLAIEAAGRN
jgi:uncharacterized tellurite resistance protein B-like protein